MHTDHTSAHPTKALLAHISTTRARNRAEQLRANAIAFVMEHLDVMAVTVAMGQKVDSAKLRQIAEQIVDGAHAIRTEAH